MEMIKAVPAAGARERFAAAAQAHTRSMYRAARTILDSDADAEDAVSEALLRAWQAFGRLKSEEALKGWLLKITVNCAREQRRKGARVTYTDDLEPLAGSVEDRRMDAVLEQLPQAAPRRGRRFYRIVAAAAVLCVLATAAGAVGVALRQTQVHFFQDEEQLLAAMEEDKTGGLNGYYIPHGGQDFDPASLAKENEKMWNDYAGGTITEERQGTEADGWTDMRAWAFMKGEGPCQAELYRAERLSGLDGLRDGPGLNVSWLEEHYNTRPGTCVYHTETDMETGKLAYESFIGGFEGEDGKSFNVECSWFYQYEMEENRYEVADGVHYVTADGVTVAITMWTTASGQQRFDASVYSGHMAWYMQGVGLELEEIQTLADHMGLAALCEYA